MRPSLEPEATMTSVARPIRRRGARCSYHGANHPTVDDEFRILNPQSEIRNPQFRWLASIITNWVKLSAWGRSAPCIAPPTANPAVRPR